MSEKLEKFVRGATHLPAMPTMIGKLLTAFDNPAFSTDELSRTIATDTTLSAKVLRMANSAFYFRMERVSTVETAAVRLGHKTVRSLVLTVWTQTFKTFPLEKTELELVSRLLEHGTATAVGASMLMQPMHAGLADEAYVAGLLHDIGRLALVCQLGKTYERDVLARVRRETQDLAAIEREVLGFDHALLGARLLQSWNIPVVAVHAAAGHHRAVVEAAKEPVVAAVALADDLATRRASHVAENALRPNLDAWMEYFRLADLPAFEAQWDAKLEALTTALDGL